MTELEGVPSAYASTRDGIDVMLRDRGLRKTRPEQTAESLLRGAHASAVLEGSGSSLEDVRAGAGDEIARASVRVSSELLAMVPVFWLLFMTWHVHDPVVSEPHRRAPVAWRWASHCSKADCGSTRRVAAIR